MSSPLLHWPHQIVARMLWANRTGLGLTDPSWWASHRVADRTDATHDWPVFYANEPAEPDECVTVYGATPVLQQKILLTGQQMKNHGLTVRVRGRTDTALGTKVLAIEHDLNEAAHDQLVTLGAQQYLVQSFPRASAVPAFRADVGGRELWVANVNCLAVILAYPLRG